MNKKKLRVVWFTTMLLVMVLFFSAAGLPALATVQSRSSDYLSLYNGYIYPAGNGEIQVWFKVTGAGTQEALGALSIQIYESTDNSNWTLVRAYSHNTYPNMMAYNTYYHSGHVDYQGVAGRYYRAMISIWGGGMTIGDNRHFYTSSKLAT